MGDLFSSRGFLPRAACGAWTPFWEELYRGANDAIGIAYVLLFIVLALSSRWTHRDRGAPFDLGPRAVAHLRMTYAVFILACGLGHFEGDVAFWWPGYRTFALWHSLTAA